MMTCFSGIGAAFSPAPERSESAERAPELGYHHSTYYYWLPLVERQGLEILRPRERRRPRMPNETPRWREQRVLALALAFPGLGPGRVAAQSGRLAGVVCKSRRAAFDTHVSHLHDKLELRARVQAVILAFEAGLVA